MREEEGKQGSEGGDGRETEKKRERDPKEPTLKLCKSKIRLTQRMCNL